MTRFLAPRAALTREFNGAMVALGPFEAAPHLAVAVSGGADSLALALLARDWVGARGGEVTALTVDHRLRPESQAEARWVRKTLAERGIGHRTLVWREGSEGGRANLQARARAARYRLMEDWCRSRGVLHLLTAHQRDDQAETLLLRLGRGSGSFGLASMGEVVERSHLRVLRPLLGIPGSALRRALARAKQDWIEDPSNTDPAYARVRVRALLPELEASGIAPGRIADAAARLGRDRRVLEGEVAGLLAAAASPDPAGFIRLSRDALLAAPRELGLRALSQVLLAVGGAPYAPRFERLERLYDEVRGACRTRTLGGCTVRLAAGGALLVCREPAAQGDAVTVSKAGSLIWDDRFYVRLQRTGGGGAGIRDGHTLGPLGREGWAAIKKDAAGFALDQGQRPRQLPALVRIGLPALRVRGRVVEVPHLGYRRRGGTMTRLKIAEVRPLPLVPLAGAVFAAPGGGASR